MAQPSNTFDSIDNANSIREDIQDIIYNISPDETPFLSACKKQLQNQLCMSGQQTH